MSDPYRYPKLRWPLDVRHHQHDGRTVLVINCPFGIAEKPLGLMAEVAPILGTFDGNLSVTEITDKFRPNGLKQELVEQLVTLLDDHLFLDSPKFELHNKKVRYDFAQSTTRDAALAGLSYSRDSTELGRVIDEYLVNGNGKKLKPEKPHTNLVGLVSPHIDYHRGGACYGIAWSSLKNFEHDLYVIIGTSHQYSQLMFHLTRKDFASPFGALACDRDFVDKLAQSYGPVRSFADELLHRREHSLELQIPFLKRLKNKPMIAPILVGGFHHMLRSGKAPQEFDEYESFAGGFAEVLGNRIKNGQRVCVVAGVDMAHVGKQFGDSAALTPEFMAQVAERDKQYLKTIEQQDKKALFGHIEEDGDRRRICGFPTMYTVLDVFDRIGIKYHAETFDYRQAVDYTTDCAVTFAGMGMFV